MNKPLVFLSHISEEAELANLIKERIERDYLGMVRVFVSSDQASITVGGRWMTDVSAALLDARILLVLCSRRSVGQPWINSESGAGWIKEIPVVPICHTGLKAADLPIPLNLLRGIIASDMADWRRVYSLLAEQLGSHAPEPSDFEEFLNQIREFEQSYTELLAGEDSKLARLRYRAGYYLASMVREALHAATRLHGFNWWLQADDPERFFLHSTRLSDNVSFAPSVNVEIDWPAGSTGDYAQKLADKLIERLLEHVQGKDQARSPDVN